MARFFKLLFWLKLPFDRIKYLSNKPTIGYGIYPTPRFHISHSASLRGRYSPRCGIPSISHGLLLDNIAYPTTSHGIWRFIPHRGDYIPQSEAEWDV